MTEEKRYPDIIRCNNSSTIGPKSTWCEIGTIKDGVVYVEIKGQHYIIPLSEIQYMIVEATNTDEKIESSNR